jgi:hypothetical protein
MGNNFFGNLFNLKKTARGKSSPSSLTVLYPAPEFRGLENWINTPPIASMLQLLGKVVLIDFWTYSCINYLNAMPYVKTWHKNIQTTVLLFWEYTRRNLVLKKNIRMLYKQSKNIR